MLSLLASSRRHTRWPRDWSSDVCSSDLFNPGWSRAELEDEQRARELARAEGVAVEAHWGLGKLQTELFEKTVEQDRKSGVEGTTREDGCRTRNTRKQPK